MRKECSIKSSYCKSLAVLVSLVVGGCAIAPTPISQSDQAALAMVDRAAAAREVEPLGARLTLSEALARGLKYNLNHRTRMMEQALAMGQWDMSRYDMLPKLMAGAGYNWRNNERITNSKDSVTGLPSLANPFISSERIHTITDLGLTWNLLDFGVSYQAAKQNADRVLVAGEHRRKSMHLLMQDISTVYWRAVSAQKIDGILRNTIREAEAALADSQKAENEKVRDPVEALRYQRTILENLRILESIKREMATAKTELAALINLPLGVDYELADPAVEELNPRRATMPVERMEEIAIGNNAELRAEFYNSRIAVAEAKKSIMKLFPGISFNYARKHDSDDYLINKSWREAGAQISWNLFNLLSMPATLRYAEANRKLGEQRRMTAQMAVLAQVHISRQQYDSAFALFKRADAIWRVDERIYAHTKSRESANVKSQLDRVLNGTSAVVSLLRRYQALSDVYAASSTVKATLGVDPQIDDLQATSLQTLANHLQRNVVSSNWDAPEPEVAVAQVQVMPSKQTQQVATGTFEDKETVAVTKQEPIKALSSTTDPIKAAHASPIYRTVVSVPSPIEVSTKPVKQFSRETQSGYGYTRAHKTNAEVLAQDRTRILNRNTVKTDIPSEPIVVKKERVGTTTVPRSQPVNNVSQYKPEHSRKHSVSGKIRVLTPTQVEAQAKAQSKQETKTQAEGKSVAPITKPASVVSDTKIEKSVIKRGVSQKVRLLTPAQVEAQAKARLKAKPKQEIKTQAEGKSVAPITKPASVVSDTKIEKPVIKRNISQKVRLLTPAQVEAKQKVKHNSNREAKVKVLTPREVEAAEKTRLRANEKKTGKVAT
ncbi:MAG: TolC family protein [Gammaproteobacteria bacterium]